jgi:periplasmic protein TonB
VPRRSAQPKPAPSPAASGRVVAPVARGPAPAVAPATPDTRVAPAPARVAKPRARKGHLAPAGALPPAQIPPEALAPSNRNGPFGISLLGMAVAVSVLLHGIVLAIHFSPFDLRQLDKGPPLEVALVNAKSAQRPAKADILAQANLDGGGNTDQNRHAKTPLPVLPKEAPNNDVALAAQKVQALEQKTQELLTQLRSQASLAPQPRPNDVPDATDSPTANQMMQRTLAAMRLEAQIARDMDAYQKRPKRRFVGARAQEYRFARYVEDWRLKVERVGNLNYPEAARANKLYGSLVLTVSIRSDGSVENVAVNRSSGRRILDAAAVRIVEMAGPYAAFPPDIRRDTDILEITRTWTFAKGDELRSN